MAARCVAISRVIVVDSEEETITTRSIAREDRSPIVMITSRSGMAVMVDGVVGTKADLGDARMCRSMAVRLPL